MDCNCYVKALTPEQQFGLRRGAHTRCCPIHRESLDPVDQIKDREVREYFLSQLWPQHEQDCPECGRTPQPDDERPTSGQKCLRCSY